MPDQEHHSLRSLVIAQDFPWVTVNGSMLRLKAVMEALATLGPVELFATVLEPDVTDLLPETLPSGAGIERWRTSGYPVARYGAADRARWVVGRLPMEVACGHYAGPRAELAQWARGPYDLVWVSKALTYEALGHPAFGPTIVDVDDLEEYKIQARLDDLGFDGAYAPSLAGRLHAGLARRQASLNARRWAALERCIAARTDAVVVCSDLDLARLGVPNAIVVPNGYDAPDSPTGRLQVGEPPVVTLQGVLFYPPNFDAVKWLVSEIAPKLRVRLPAAQVRLVGPESPPVRAMHDPPRVTVTGRVEDITTELALADIVAVPIRFGSGTRIKILEAFAHRIPVVTTTMGAEGIDVSDGEHLLLADTADDFADACARLLQDVPLRQRLVDNAERLVRERYTWDAAREVVTAAARQLTAARVSSEPQPSGTAAGWRVRRGRGRAPARSA